MSAATKTPLAELTANDLMAGDLVLLPEDMPLRQAARLLLKNQIGGAPVVDAKGRCVGVLSSIDFLRMAERREQVASPTAPSLPLTCSFQTNYRTSDGRDIVLCDLAPGVCSIQVKETGPGGEPLLVCSQPHCVLVDWQIVELEKLPNDEVRQFMTPDPVTVSPTTPIHALARMMIDAHFHRVIVVDEERRPLGVVSSTDLLTALANNHET